MWNDLLPWQQSLHSNSMKTCWQRQCPLSASGYSSLFVRTTALIAEAFTHTHAHTSLSVLPSNIDCPFSVRSPITRPLDVLLCLDTRVEEEVSSEGPQPTFLKASFSSYLNLCCPEQSTRVCLMIVHLTNGLHWHVTKNPKPVIAPFGRPQDQSSTLLSSNFCTFRPPCFRLSPGLCTSCAGRTLGLWRALGPGEIGSGPEACSQTSWQTCWHTPAAGWSAPGWPRGHSLHP